MQTHSKNLNSLLLRSLLAGVAVFLISNAAQAVSLLPQEQQIATYLTTNSQQHRPFMHLDPILSQVARARAQDMANRNYFGHVNPDGFGPDYMVMKAGYKLPPSWGTDPTANYIESISAGYTTAAAAWEGWMESTPHKTHLLALDPFYVTETNYGVGFAYDPNSTYQYYWVVITAPPQIVDLAITSPASGTQVTSPDVIVTGTTDSTPAAALVQFRVENAGGTSDFQTADGTASWSGTASNLAPGMNTIRAISYSSTGSQIAEESVNIDYYVPSTLTVTISGSGTVTAGFSGTTTRAVGNAYAISPKPASGYLFDHWSGDVTSRTAALTFTMQPDMALQANFIPNPFIPAKGNYDGLTIGGSAAGGTPFSLSLGSAGTYSGKVVFEGKSYSFHGGFDTLGNSTVTILRKNEAPIVVTFSLDLSTDAHPLTGTISDGTTTESIATAQGMTAPTDLAGSYTVVIPPDESGSNSTAPQGNGMALVKVGSKGSFRVVGSLADGTGFSESGVLTRDANLPLFASLYGSKGSLSGVLTFRSLDTSDLDGAVTWMKPVRSKDKLYPDGFIANSVLVGSHYTAPVKTTGEAQQIEVPASTILELGNGGLAKAIDQEVTIASNDAVTVAQPDANKITLSVSASSGYFTGHFTHPVTGATTTFRGVLLQKQNAGFGWFTGPGASGYASLGLN